MSFLLLFSSFSWAERNCVFGIKTSAPVEINCFTVVRRFQFLTQEGAPSQLLCMKFLQVLAFGRSIPPGPLRYFPPFWPVDLSGHFSPSRLHLNSLHSRLVDSCRSPNTLISQGKKFEIVLSFPWKHTR